MPLNRDFLFLIAAGGLLAMGLAVADGAATAPSGSGAQIGAPAAAAPAAAVVAPNPADMQAVQPQYWFGVAVENIPPGIARQLKLKADQGLMVVAILPDSPAERAGLKADDLLIEIDHKALTSQEELARAANTRNDGKPNAGGPSMKSSTLTFLREGERQNALLTPALRPASMQVLGDNAQNFTPANGPVRPVPEMHNFVLPNGGAAQVGPGYPIDLQGNSSTFKSLRKVMEKGETVVMSEETDALGNKKCTLSVVGGAKYAVEAGHLDKLPPDLQPLAEQMLANAAHPAGRDGAVSPAHDLTALERRIDLMQQQQTDLLKQNFELKQRVNDLEQKQKAAAPAEK